MLDIKLIREDPDGVCERLRAKGREAEEDIKRILELDTLRRTMISENEAKKAEQNRQSKLIPAMKKEGRDTTEVFASMKTTRLFRMWRTNTRLSCWVCPICPTPI